MIVRHLLAGSLLLTTACLEPRISSAPNDGPSADSADAGLHDAREPAPPRGQDSDPDADRPTSPDAAQDRDAGEDASSPDAEAGPGTGLPAEDGGMGDAAADLGDTALDADANDVVAGSFYVRGEVVGELGDGLALSLNDGPSISVTNRDFRFPTALATGETFEVEVTAQPVAPAATCSFDVARGLVDDHDVVLELHCDPLGGLRISEVGSCYYYDTACWFELYNAGAAEEDLSRYQVRTPAAQGAPPYAVSGQKTFDLPSYDLGPGEYAVVAAKSSQATPDGQGLLHVSNDSYLPWWGESGFVEVLSEQRTVDFLRFGDSQQEPSTPGTFEGGSAEALVSGPLSYGFSLSRSRWLLDTNRPEDFSVRAFATPGGPNDVTSEADEDGDGLPDAAETRGSRFAGLDLYAMGARVGVRDLFVEIDHMEPSEPAMEPVREALDKLVRVFADQGIAIHLDVGELFSDHFDPDDYNLGGGNVVPFSAGVSFQPTESGVASVYDYKANHMAVERRSIFYYMLFGYSQEADGSPGAAGVGEILGNDTIITLGGYGLSTKTARRRNLLANYQASTMMHELGHNLGLRHGGDEDTNYKPNYVSVMNYLYGSLGLPVIGSQEGDRYDLITGCSLSYVSQLERGPTEAPEDFLMDFSHGEGGDIDEARIWESNGLGHLTSVAVDYNCNGKTDQPYAADLNFDGKLSSLRDFDDWGNLLFVFARSPSSNDSALPLLRKRRVRRPTNVQLNDHQPVASVPCPGLGLRTGMTDTP